MIPNTFPLPPAFFTEHDPINKVAGLTPMVMVHCDYPWMDSSSWAYWLNGKIPGIIEQLKATPKGRRCLYLSWFMEYEVGPKRYGELLNGDAAVSPLSPNTISTAERQGQLLAAVLKANKIYDFDIYIDNEGLIKGEPAAEGMSTIATMLHKAVQPLLDLGVRNRVFNYNYGTWNPAFPTPHAVWGRYATDCSVNGNNCFSVSLPTHFAGSPCLDYTTTPGVHPLWCAFIDAINVLRNGVSWMGSQQVFPMFGGPLDEDPIHRDNVATVRRLNIELMKHARALGISRFGLSNYMLLTTLRSECEAEYGAEFLKLPAPVPCPEFTYYPISYLAGTVSTGGQVTTHFEDYFDYNPKVSSGEVIVNK